MLVQIDTTSLQLKDLLTYLLNIILLICLHRNSEHITRQPRDKVSNLQEVVMKLMSSLR